MLYKLALIGFFLTVPLSVLALDPSNQTCTLDSECSQAGGTHFDGVGDWFCSKGRCKYLVAAGQPCQVASDCAVSSLTLFSDGCSAEHCGLQSLCDAPTNNKPLPGQLKCCKPLAPMANCPSESSLNLCSEGQACLDGKCDLVNNTARQIWLGVILVICGAVTLNIGLNLQKLGYRRWSPPLARPATMTTMTMMSEDDVIMRDTTVVSMLGTTTEGRAGAATMTEGTIPVIMEQEPEGICEKISFWRQVPLTNPIWLVGFILFILGNISGFIALRYAPQSLVAPLGAFSIVTNVVIAPYINHESLSWWDGLGVGLICLGSTMTVIFSGYVAPEYKLCVLLALLQQRATIIYLLVIATLILLIYIFIKVTEGRLIKRLYNWWLDNNNSPKQVYQLETTTAAADVLVESGGDAIEDSEKNTIEEEEEGEEGESGETFAFKYCLPLAYSSLGALMATLTTLLAKSLINLLVISLTTQQNQFTSFLSWIILLVTMITALSQIYWINMGLKRYDAMLLQVPVFYCVWTVFDIIGGGIYYNEFRAFTLLKYILFGLGVAVIFTGIVFLARRLHH